jgi:hypothetical protein
VPGLPPHPELERGQLAPRSSGGRIRQREPVGPTRPLSRPAMTSEALHPRAMSACARLDLTSHTVSLATRTVVSQHEPRPCPRPELGPYWVRTASGTPGRPGARTVTAGIQESQVTDISALDLGQRNGVTAGSNPTSTLGPACPAAANSRPPQPRSRVLASARIAPRRPPAALDPGRGPWPEACQQPGRQRRAISMPYSASTRGS